MKQSAALVLTGGGARASYQVGVLQALREILPDSNPPFQMICGTSAGAINAAYLASHIEDWSLATGGLFKLWSHLELDQVYRTDSISLSRIAFEWISRTMLGGKGGTRKRANYLLNTEPLWNLLAKEVRFEKIRGSIAKGTLHAVSFSTVHYFTGMTISFFDAIPECRTWTRSNRMGVRCQLGVEHVMASASIPVFFPPVEIDREYYGDGCLRQTTPLSPAVHLGADRIISIGIRHDRKKNVSQSLPKVPRNSPSLAEIIGELMNSLFLDSLEADVERLTRVNESLSKMPAETHMKHLSQFRQIPILQLRPSRDLGEIVPNLLKRFPPTLRYLFKGLGVSENEGKELLSYLAFLDECIGPLMELGYEDTLRRREEIIQFME